MALPKPPAAPVTTTVFPLADAMLKLMGGGRWVVEEEERATILGVNLRDPSLIPHHLLDSGTHASALMRGLDRGRRSACEPLFWLQQAGCRGAAVGVGQDPPTLCEGSRADLPSLMAHAGVFHCDIVLLVPPRTCRTTAYCVLGCPTSGMAPEDQFPRSRGLEGSRGEAVGGWDSIGTPVAICRGPPPLPPCQVPAQVQSAGA